MRPDRSAAAHGQSFLRCKALRVRSLRCGSGEGRQNFRGCIAVVENGKLTHAAGIGLRDLRLLSPVTSDTLFRIASISKTVLATAAMALVEQGMLDVDAPVKQYVPKFFADVSVRQVLNQTSGFSDAYDRVCEVGPGSVDRWLQN